MSQIDPASAPGPVSTLDAWIDALATGDEACEVVIPRDLHTVEIGGRLPAGRIAPAA